MLKVNNFKLLQKFLILAVLAIGLGFSLTIQPTRTEAWGCCSDCDAVHFACIADCNNTYPNNPTKRIQCIQEVCNPPFFSCMRHCDPNC